MFNLSVFIIIKNEEKRIAKTIEAVKNIADEIIIIDSGSTDNSCEIARKMGCRVIYNQWQGFGPQKVFGESQCKNDWILNIDADELLSDELIKEIKELLSNDRINDYIGYRIKIVNKFCLEEKPHKFAYFYNQLRLYNRKFAGFSSSVVHDSVLIKSYDNNSQITMIEPNSNIKIGQLYSIIHHQSFLSFNHWIEKINFYSQLQALEAFSKNKNIPYYKIFLSPLLAFFKALILRRYFIYGFDGIIYSLIFAFSRFVKMIKIREMFRNRTNQDKSY